MCVCVDSHWVRTFFLSIMPHSADSAASSGDGDQEPVTSVSGSRFVEMLKEVSLWLYYIATESVMYVILLMDLCSGSLRVWAVFHHDPLWQCHRWSLLRIYQVSHSRHLQIGVEGGEMLGVCGCVCGMHGCKGAWGGVLLPWYEADEYRSLKPPKIMSWCY